MPGVDRLVVVGGGLGAARVVEEARRLGFDGSITIISEEQVPPYDRPPLSKQFLTDPGSEPTTLVGGFEGLDAEILLGTTARFLDARNRRVVTDLGEVRYDVLVIATGATPRRLGVESGAAGVTALRTVDDARLVRSELAPGARVIVVGAGFIGGEVASSARAMGAEVTMIESRSLPLVHAVGPLVAERLALLHRQNGVTVLTERRVLELIGAGRVEQVRLDDGAVLPADLVVVGVGVEPATGWLRGSGIALTDGVACDPFLESTVAGVYAVGDVARWVNPWNGRSSRLEHWTAVGDQARSVVGNALTTAREPCSIVPYFWSDWYGHRLQMLGDPADGVDLTGDGDSGPFLAQYRSGGSLVGAFGLDRTGPLMRLRRSITERSAQQDRPVRPPTPASVGDTG